MISRLSAFAALFAVLATSLTVAASAGIAAAHARQFGAAAAPMTVYQLERVVVTGKRVAGVK